RARGCEEELSRPCGSGAFDCHTADSQPRHGRRESLPASALLVFPPRGGELFEERRIGVLRGDGRESTTRSSVVVHPTSFIHLISRRCCWRSERRFRSQAQRANA